MPHLLTPAVLHQQMPANEIRQTRAVLEVIMPGHRATWSELGACEEIADLLKWSAVLQGNAHQAGNYVVETDQFGGAVRAFDAQEDFCRLRVVMDAQVERALASDSDLLRDVVTTVGKGKAGGHRPPKLLPYKRCRALPVLASQHSLVVVVLLLVRAWPPANVETSAEADDWIPGRVPLNGSVPVQLGAELNPPQSL